MKKSILTIAVVAASVVAPAAMAAPTVYGNIHLSLNAADNDIAGANNNLKMSSNTSSLGVKGSEDLGDGLKAIYKAEWEIDISGDPTTNPDAGNPKSSGSGLLTGRDQFVGLKGGMGKVMFGTFSSNYKQKGGKVDSLYRTPLEGRGFLKTQSGLHGGKGVNKGRMTDTISYTSPKMGGIELVVNGTFSGSEDETIGAGLRWSNKSILAYIDWIDQQPIGAVSTADTESAMKVGAKFKAKAFHISGQYEMSEDVTDFDYIHVNGGFNFNKNNSVEVTFGTATHIDNGALDSDGIAVAYNHKMSKMTNVYLGYGSKSADAGDESMITAGIRKKF